MIIQIYNLTTEQWIDILNTGLLRLKVNNKLYAIEDNYVDSSIKIEAKEDLKTNKISDTEIEVSINNAEQKRNNEDLSNDC